MLALLPPIQLVPAFLKTDEDPDPGKAGKAFAADVDEDESFPALPDPDTLANDIPPNELALLPLLVLFFNFKTLVLFLLLSTEERAATLLEACAAEAQPLVEVVAPLMPPNVGKEG